MLIVIDKISMMNWMILNMLDRILCSLMNKYDYMGEKCIVLIRDLRQCPSLVKQGGQSHVAVDSRYHPWRIIAVFQSS